MQSGTEAAEQIRRQAESLSGKPHVSYATGDFEWYSPAEYIGAARVVLGEIDLDPASTETANTVVKACRIFTAEQDGLTQTWTGRVWMNPPYASGIIDRFVEKLIASFECGDVPAAVVLVNNATETVWFQSLAQTAAAICFPAKRMRFAHPDRGTPGQPFQGQAVLYLGKEAAKFRSAFRAFGFIVEPSERDNGNQLGYFGPIPTQAERTNVNELHAQLRAMWPAGQDVLAKSSCVTSVWR